MEAMVDQKTLAQLDGCVLTDYTPQVVATPSTPSTTSSTTTPIE